MANYYKEFAEHLKWFEYTCIYPADSYKSLSKETFSLVRTSEMRAFKLNEFSLSALP